MPKVRARDSKVAKSPAPKDDGIMASSFGSEDFSQAFDECASGKIADEYRSFEDDDCEHGIPVGIIKNRMAHFSKQLRKDEIAKKVLDLPVTDALSNWRDSEYDWEKDLNARKVVQDALKFAQRYGCSVVLPIIKNPDGNIIPQSRSLDSIVDEYGAGNLTVDKLIHSKGNLSFEGEIEEDFYKPLFGLPKKMKVGTRTVHPSRAAFFGDLISTKLMSILGDLADYHESKRRLAIAVRRNSGIILTSDFQKISAFLLAKKRATGSAPDMAEITKERARSLYQNINDVNVAVINKDEKVDQYDQSNIDELIKNVELQMQILSGVADIPISRLFQKLRSGGIGNTSETEFLNYSQSLMAWRADNVDEPLGILDNIMSQAVGVELSDWNWNVTRAEELWLKLKSGNTQDSEAES